MLDKGRQFIKKAVSLEVYEKPMEILMEKTYDFRRNVPFIRKVRVLFNFSSYKWPYC